MSDSADLTRVAGIDSDSAAMAQRIARQLHGNPETSMNEHQSAELLRSELAAAGFSVSGVPGCPTAFLAESGAGSRTVALCLEYDSLPGIGHGCGHHLIAAAGMAAAVAVSSDLIDLGVKLRVMGTPAEERGGGKIMLLEQGAFEGIDAAMMVHFVPEGFSANPAGTSSYAVGRERIVFTGRAAHAAAAPQEGRNAADAAVVAQVAVGLLRQQIRSDDRIGLYVVSGGLSTNIIPAEATVDLECRSATWEGYLSLRNRVHRCFHAAAYATECDYQISDLEPPYQPLRQDAALARLWTAAIAARGYAVDERPLPGKVSTDMGNVSQQIPSIHPWVSIAGVTAPIHTQDFADATIGPAAIAAMLDAGAALAETIRAWA